MSSPLIWIIIPLFIAVILWFLQRNRKLVLAAASTFCGFLILLTRILPLNSVISIGPVSFEISTLFQFLGRRFSLDEADMPFLGLVYGIGLVWFLGALVVHVHRSFIPLALAVIALLVAARAVEPFLYAALLIEMAVLISVPMFTPPGARPGLGVVRFLTFETLGMPFILLAGWAANAVDANPADQLLLVRAAAMLGLGFAFWLAVFPFYTWMPLLASETNPYTVGFMFCLLPTVVLLFLADFLNAYTWLRNFSTFTQGIRLVGVLMIATGGFWAVFQTNLSRLFSYAIIVESGYSLIALSIGTRESFEIFLSLFLARIVAIATWTLSANFFEQYRQPTFENIRGLIMSLPWLAAGFLSSFFSLAGLPLLAGFPQRFELLEQLAQRSIGSTIWVVLGTAGIMTGGVRILSSVVVPGQNETGFQESWIQRIFLLGGLVALLILGLFPQLASTFLLPLAGAFSRLY